MSATQRRLLCFSTNNKAAGHKTGGFALSLTCRVLGRHRAGCRTGSEVVRLSSLSSQRGGPSPRVQRDALSPTEKRYWSNHRPQETIVSYVRLTNQPYVGYPTEDPYRSPVLPCSAE
jgi:hypothetical protein